VRLEITNGEEWFEKSSCFSLAFAITCGGADSETSAIVGKPFSLSEVAVTFGLLTLAEYIYPKMRV
jgi:hypothetical protein